MPGRREIIAALTALAAGPAIAWPRAEAVVPRRPWRAFVGTRDYARFVDAIARMKAKRDPRSPDSWAFWADIHQTHCPHGKDYFLAWHRGYLHLFERKLREVAGHDALRLPYWDYFADARVPAELGRGDAASNPLFAARKGASVGGALAYGAFADGLTGFPRGAAPSFEAQIESCHNNVHNLVGGAMATMQSPQDVLFWLHHANIDRLWAGWLAAGRGRAMPAADQAYWAGRFDYAADTGVERGRTVTCEALGYRYDDLALPEPAAAPVVPPPAEAPRVGVPAPAAPPPPPPPPPVAAAPAPIPMEAVFLDETPLSLWLPVRRPAAEAEARPGDVAVILDALSLTAAGEEGGYFYKVYLELDEATGDPEDRLLGTIGPFQVAAALNHAHHGEARIVLPAAELLGRLAPGRDVRELRVSFVRVAADGAPGGPTIGIGSLAIQG